MFKYQGFGENGERRTENEALIMAVGFLFTKIFFMRPSGWITSRLFASFSL